MVIYFLLISLLSLSAIANNNSRWDLLNNTNNEVTTVCVHKEHGQILAKAIRPWGFHSKRFNMSYGRGLGFPETKAHISCHFTGKNLNQKVNFNTIDWGDYVQITIEKNNIEIKTTTTWPTKRSKTDVFKW